MQNNQHTFEDFYPLLKDKNQKNKSILNQLKVELHNITQHTEVDDLMYHCKAKEYHKFGIRTEVTIVITKTNIFIMNINSHPPKILKRMPLKMVRAITRYCKGAKPKFIIHVSKIKDAIYSSVNIDIIIRCIKCCFFGEIQRNVPIYIIKSDMCQFATNLHILKSKQYTILPSNHLIDKSQDLYESVTNASWIDLADDVENLKKVNQMLNPPEHVFQIERRTSTVDSYLDSNYSNHRQSVVIFQAEKLELKLEDLQFIKILGKGTFGKVYFALGADQQAYAVKILRKDKILHEEWALEKTIQEKQILEKNKHPFIMQTECVFANPERIFFVMNYAQGGDLFQILKKETKFTENRAKFYISIIAQAIGFLHQNQIIHRDIRPENILMHGNGYLCLSNFGVAKTLKSKEEVAQSFFGDLDYQSPEMLLAEGHSYPVDWWSLGIMTYHMVVGVPPFIDQNQAVHAENIVNGNVVFPNEISPECKDFVNGLLKKEPNIRLATKAGLNEILDHAWMNDVDHCAIIEKTLEPPFKPIIHEEFNGYFNSETRFTTIEKDSQKYLNQNKGLFEDFGQNEQIKQFDTTNN